LACNRIETDKESFFYFMQLTRAADYAVRVMIHLAGQPVHTRASRADLAEAAECPEQFLSKVLQSLTRAGLVISHRGNTGGFELPDSTRDVSVLEVVEAIEGPVRLNLCLTHDHACARQSWCPAHPIWAEAQQAMAEVLQKATIQSLAQRAVAPAGNGGSVVIDPRPWN
jgi:Rrf2 family protein